MKIAVFAAIYNDADFGIEDAGISRACPRSMRAASRAPASAPGARASATDNRPGATAIVTAVNERAAQCGGEIGISAPELVARLVAARVKELQA